MKLYDILKVMNMSIKSVYSVLLTYHIITMSFMSFQRICPILRFLHYSSSVTLQFTVKAWICA